MVWTILNDNEDKTNLPNYLKDLYSREPHQVHSLLSTLINPKDTKNKLDVEKCLWVICGGQKPEEFTRIIKANDRSVKCGLVWDANFIAYRCKTCGITPCMSLCAECFENGNHEGHDFNMFRSGAGGACDCGDIEVMKPCGFCSRHGPQTAKNTRDIPEDITLMVNLVVPKLIYFLLFKLEDATVEKHGKVHKADEEVAKLLLKLCEMGDVTRNIVAKSMLQVVQKKSVPSHEASSKFIVKSDMDMPPYNVIRRQSSTDSTRHPTISESGIQSLSDSENSRIQHVADSIHSCPGTSKDCDISYIAHGVEENETVLEKLIDLLIDLKFPQFLVTLVLSMLQETEYKKEFMRAFCSRYSKIANLLTHRFEMDEDQKLCNRLVHASVQLFSNENLTYNMVKHNNLLSIIVTALNDLISRTLIKVDDNDDNINKSLFVVNCNHEIIHYHRYWPVVSDFHNLLSHNKIARYFLGEAALIRRWMGILTHFTGMNKNIRQLIVHVPYESLTYQYAYSTEIETSSHIMTNLLSVCTSANDKDFIRLVLSECVRALRSWFRMIQVQIVKPFLSDLDGDEMTSTGPVPRHEITFHLPLHRYLAGFISQAVNFCGMSLEEVLPSEEVLWCVMEHVLRIQVGIGEILAGLWVRNGYQLRSQEEFYLQGQYCNQCVDLDIFLLQVCVMALDSDQLLKMIIQRYKLESWFKFGVFASSTQPADHDVQQSLVENMLNLILQLIYQRMYMGLSEKKMVHLEVVTKLMMGDFTHSQLTDNLPDKPGLNELTELFDKVLSEVSDYKQPSNELGQLTQGIYALKPDLWKSEFQPLHVMLRGSYKRGYQLAMDKYKGWYQTQNKTKVQGLWPPFRAPVPLNQQYQSLYRILSSRTLHAILFTVLYKAAREPGAVNDNIIYLSFYLIDMCISAPERAPVPNIEKGCLKPDITAAELEDGTVPSAIVKCILFLQEHRHLPTLYKGKAVEQRVQDLCRKLISSPNTFTIKPDQYTLQDVTQALLLMCNNRLQPPLFSRINSAAKQLSVTTGLGTAMFDKKTHVYHIQQVLEQLPPHRYKMINLLTYYLSTLVKEELATLDLICSVYVPSGVDSTAFSSMISCYDWMFRVRTRPADSLESMFDIKYKSDSIIKNAYECVLGTSMLQCMYEVRKKLQSIDFSQSPGTSNTYTSHNGVDAISVILSKLGEKDKNNARLLRSLERDDASTPDRGCSPCSSSEAKRKRAKERQAKLLAAFVSKQRDFEAQMEAEDINLEEDESVRSKDSTGHACIICGTSSISTEDNPLGVFVMTQPASLLLHSIPPDVEREIMDDRFGAVPTFHSTMNEHYNTLNSLYSSTSAWRNAGLRAQPGLHIQSCSHILHIGCYKTYSDSQQNRTPDPLHNPLAGKELSCPICRRISNTVLPLPPKALTKPYVHKEVKVPVSPLTQIPIPFSHTCTDSLYMSVHPPSCLGCALLTLTNNIKQIAHQAPIDMINSTIIKSTSSEYYDYVDSFISSLEEYYKRYVEQKSLSRLDIIMLSLHCTLQCELTERDNILSSQMECSRKYCTGNLISVLATSANFLVDSHSSNEILLSLIEVLYKGEEKNYRNRGNSTSDVPVVLQEPSWILLKFVLFSRLQTDWENYKTVVRSLYTLQVVRSLISVVSRFSADEQLAWIHKAAPSNNCDDFEAILGMLCRELSSIGVNSTVGEMDITSYVWSIQSVEANVQTLCLPLLREAVLLGHHMYNKPLPGSSGACEFSHLASWLGFLNNSNTPRSFISVLNLPREKLLSVCCELCRQLPLPNKQKLSPLTKPLLPLVSSWNRPKLLTLPKLYGKLYLHYRHIKCKVCRLVPNDPAICLVCGELVCVRSQCCLWINTGECTKHAQTCGAGTAIYLVIMSSTVVIIRGERVYLWGSVYLDQHDEEDIDLKRGKPLYLSETRYKCLNQQWISHSFDHTLKRWGWHQQMF